MQVFRNELARTDPAPEVLALSISGIAYPDIDIAAALAEIDALAERVAAGLASCLSAQERVGRLMEVLHDELKFGGDEERYYDPDNSYLNIVLERRVGLPIMLSVLCIAIGRRLKLTVDGLGFPAHFVAKYAESDEAWILDLFHGRIARLDEAESYLSRVVGHPTNLTPAALRPVDSHYIARRILANLRGVYLAAGDTEKSVRVLDYLVELMPANPAVWNERGILHTRTGNWEESSRDMRRYCYLTGRLEQAVRAMQGQRIHEIALAAEERKLLQTVKYVEDMRARIN